MKKIEAYQSVDGTYESTPERAIGWDIKRYSKKNDRTGHVIDFTQALWIIENRDFLRTMFDDLEAELRKNEQNS